MFKKSKPKAANSAEGSKEKASGKKQSPGGKDSKKKEGGKGGSTKKENKPAGGGEKKVKKDQLPQKEGGGESGNKNKKQKTGEQGEKNSDKKGGDKGSFKKQSQKGDKPHKQGDKDSGDGSQKKKTWTKGAKPSWQQKNKRKAPPAPKTKKELRAAKKARSAAKPGGTELLKANEVWSIFTGELKKADRESKIAEILKDVTGKLLPVCSKHDGSRAIQKMIKYGAPAQRLQIYKELQGHMAELSLDKHAHFIVIGLLKCEVEEIRKAVIQELLPKVVKLSMHNTAGSVIDYMYASGKPKERLRILAEFYGKEHALFGKLDEGEVQTLEELLKAHPEKKDVILLSIQTHLDKCSTKDVFLFRPLHGLIAAYLPLAKPISREQLIAICSGKVLALHHSLEGATVMCDSLGYGSAKTRKSVIKGLKGRVHDLACSPSGHIILIRALQVIDDVVLVNTGILNELKEHVDELLLDPFGSKVLLYLATPNPAGIFTDTDRALLAPATKDGEATSKKNPVVRRTEVFLKSIGWILAAMQQQMSTLISQTLPCKVVVETLMHAYQVSDPSYAQGEGKEVGAEDQAKLLAVRPAVMKAVEALAQTCSQEAHLPLLEDSNVHHHLMRLITKTLPSSKETAACFSKAFLPLVSPSPLSSTWLSNRGAFLLATILESDDSLKLPLQAHLPAIKQVDNAGTKLLAQVLEENAEQRQQRLAAHKDEGTREAPASASAKKKKKKKKKVTKLPVDGSNEYQDPAIVGKKKSKLPKTEEPEEGKKKKKKTEEGTTSQEKKENKPATIGQQSKSIKIGESNETKEPKPNKTKAQEPPVESKPSKKSKGAEPKTLSKATEMEQLAAADLLGDDEGDYEGDEYGDFGEGDEGDDEY